MKLNEKQVRFGFRLVTMCEDGCQNMEMMNMQLLRALFKRSTPGASIRCCACKTEIGPAKKVKHAISVGELYLPFCDACHRELVKRNDALHHAIENHVRGGRYSRDEVNPFTSSGTLCLRCAKRIDGTVGVENLDKTASGLSITVSRPRRSGEQVANLYGKERTAPVAEIFTLCISCAKDYLPNLRRLCCKQGGPRFDRVGA